MQIHRLMKLIPSINITQHDFCGVLSKFLSGNNNKQNFIVVKKNAGISNTTKKLLVIRYYISLILNQTIIHKINSHQYVRTCTLIQNCNWIIIYKVVQGHKWHVIYVSGLSYSPRVSCLLAPTANYFFHSHTAFVDMHVEQEHPVCSNCVGESPSIYGHETLKNDAKCMCLQVGNCTWIGTFI